MWSNLFKDVEQMETVKYKKNYLSNVIMQYQVSQKASSDLLEGDVLKAVLKEYPLIQPDTEEKQCNLRMDSTTPQASFTNFIRKEFLSNDGNYKLTFNLNFITFEVKKYTCFEELVQKVDNILLTILRDHAELIILRIGLRYIDIFEEQKNMKSFFQNGIQDYIKRFEKPISDDIKVSKAMSREEYIVEDVRAILQYGYFNQYFPAELKDKQFVIDTDIIFQGGIQKIEDIKDKIVYMKDIAQIIFENCITDKMRGLLNE